MGLEKKGRRSRKDNNSKSTFSPHFQTGIAPADMKKLKNPLLASRNLIITKHLRVAVFIRPFVAGFD
jgi:hypothetical protein